MALTRYILFYTILYYFLLLASPLLAPQRLALLLIYNTPFASSPLYIIMQLISLPALLLATQSIEARVQQEGRASLYDWIVYKRESKARERKGEKEQRRLIFYAIFALRNRNLRQSVAICQYCNTVRDCLKLSTIVRYNPLL